MMKADDVAHYLQSHPKFFEDYAELLAHLYVPHPHTGRAISITERQILGLREKARKLESKLVELIHFGEENDAIGEKVHQFVLTLLAAGDAVSTLAVARHQLQAEFRVPFVALRLWAEHAPLSGPEVAPVSEALRDSASAWNQPYCGPVAETEALGWFGDAAPELRSMALVPLRHGGRVVGLLALGSDDPQRFYPEMGTLFLERMGDMLGAALTAHSR